MIRYDDTPNGNSLKFHVIGLDLLEEGVSSYDFRSREEAQGVRLVEGLFAIEYVEGVLLIKDAVVVTKDGSIPWQYIRNDIICCIENFLDSDDEVNVKLGAKDNNCADMMRSADDYSEGEREVVLEILRIIDENIRPLLLGDGGDIIFIKYDAGDVYVKLQGACHGCPSATVTLKHGIQNMLRFYISDVKQVIAV
ncbi:MAG: thioredoxin [Candidatus Xenolissoclinum pacificiensis L6]|uniref:Thioredoxin n=1 Tax=Candidatus Xenolissoclinum pacificiensis L6 TaxID=1401685 RepID=W2V1R6_9RICK|nr:MAG: thioredoxin [Candidatus Xenolissoclinum pacificiensis L6]